MLQQQDAKHIIILSYYPSGLHAESLLISWPLLKKQTVHAKLNINDHKRHCMFITETIMLKLH